MEPLCSVFPSGKGSPISSLQLPWELLWFEQHQSHPCLGRQSPALISEWSVVMESTPIYYCQGQESSSLQP